MHKNTQKQMPLMIMRIDHPHADELEGISQILDANPIILIHILMLRVCKVHGAPRSLSDLPRFWNEEARGNGCQANDALKSEMEGIFSLHFPLDFDKIT